MLLLHLVLAVVKENGMRVVIQETLATRADLVSVDALSMAHEAAFRLRHLVGLVIRNPVRAVRRFAHVDLHPVHTVSLVIAHRADAPVDGYLVEVGAT